MIFVSYEGSGPKLSQAVVAELMEIYVGEYVQMNRARGAHEFLVRQTEDLYAKLAGTEQGLCDLKSGVNRTTRETVADVAPVVSPEQRREELGEQLGIVERALLQALAEEAALQARTAKLKETLAGLPETQVTAKVTGLHPASAGMRASLYDLELKEQELLANSREDFFEVQEIQRQIDRAKAILQEQPLRTESTEGPNRRYEEVQTMLHQDEPALVAVQARIVELRRQQDLVGNQLRDFNDRDLQLRRLEREYELQDANYRKYVANLEQSRIDQALEDARISSIQIVQPATLEIEPVRPRPLLNLAVGLVLGVFGGVGVAFLSEYLRQTLRTPEEIERELDLRVLASIPKLTRQELAIHA